MRKKLKVKHPKKPDFVYDSIELGRFINYIMKDGKKNVARKVVYGALEDIKKREKGSEPLKIFEAALKNVGPSMEVRSRRIGGANYQVPREVRPERRSALAMRWIVLAANAKSGKPMTSRLADELLAASKEEGEAIKRKENIHKMAEANRAFAHFAW